MHWPKWRLDKETQDWVADWDETIPRRNWCAVLEAAGIWVVCGRVTICDTTDPVAELTVTANPDVRSRLSPWTVHVSRTFEMEGSRLGPVRG